jgi:Ca2+-binding EF-hand superfamily protein
MELVLEGTEGIPQNAILSIKIGELRRQAPITKIGQAFRFSSSPVEPLPMKVEVFTPAVPMQSVILDALAKDVVVDLPDIAGSNTNMRVRLRKETVEALQRPVPNVDQIAEAKCVGANQKENAAQAKTYLEQHGLVRTFQDLLHGLLVSKPEDPWLYLDEHLARAKKVAAQSRRQPGRPEQSVPKSPSRAVASDAGETDQRRRGSIKTRSKVEALLDILRKTKENLHLILPYLPKEMSAMLVSEELNLECQRQFVVLDKSKEGFLRPEELIPVIEQLSTANSHQIDRLHVEKFIALFDENKDGTICFDEFTSLTQFVIIAAHLESEEGQALLAHISGQESSFKSFLDMLEQDKGRINEIVPFLPDWLVTHLTSEKFLDECMEQFCLLDVDQNGKLSPHELLPIVMHLSKIDQGSVNFEKCERFVKVFDIHKDGVIRQDEFLEFAQFMAVTNFLVSTTEGQQIHEAALHQAELRQCDDLIKKLESGIENLPDVLRILPTSFIQEIQSQDFAKECVEGFQRLDTNGNGVLEPVELFPVIIQLASGHPMQMDDAQCQKFTELFDKDHNGVISINEFADLCKYIIVMGYLQFIKQWRENTVSHGHAMIESLLGIMKDHRDKLHEILPLLPYQLHAEITSDAFIDECLLNFNELDKDRNGTLEPKELVPAIIEICQAHPISLTKEQCLRFVDFYDADGNGVICKTEFIDFVRFVMVMAYLETEDGQAINTFADMSIGEKKVEDLLYKLEHDRNAIHKIVPLLPEKLFEQLTSDAFVQSAHDRFEVLDTNKNGMLCPQELFPVICEMGEAHPYAVTMQQCERFTKIFDIKGDGVIRKDEFVDFARFMCIMMFLHSDEGKQEFIECFKIMEDSREIDELIRMLESDWHDMRKVIPYLPEDLRDELLSETFRRDCIDRFKELDCDRSGSLNPTELYPVLMDMTSAHHHALDFDQCKRFTAIFDSAKTGVISQSEFLDLARFLVTMAYLQTPDGQASLSLMSSDHATRPQNALPSGRSGKASTPASPNSVGHLTVDLEYYQKKSEKLSSENGAQRQKLIEMEATMRAMQDKLEKQQRELRHVQLERSQLNLSQ